VLLADNDYTDEIYWFLGSQFLSPSGTRRDKRAFTTCRVPKKNMVTLIAGDLPPSSGDMLLTTVHELGKHQRIKQLSEHRALIGPGDEVSVC
jgi:hypothetical protein